jgi:hypothetical protein
LTVQWNDDLTREAILSHELPPLFHLRDRLILEFPFAPRSGRNPYRNPCLTVGHLDGKIHGAV